MNWKFWKRDNNPEYVIQEHSLPISTLFRWYCYDLHVSSPNKIAESVGLNPISMEGEEKEKQDSQKRLFNVFPFMGFLNTIAEINATVILESQSNFLKGLKDEVEIENFVSNMKDTYKLVSLSALTSAFSSALELNLITNDFNTRIIEEGVFDE